MTNEETTVAEPTRLEEFAKTSQAANASGTYNELMGFLKRKIGKLTGNPQLKDEGNRQQVLGRIHHVVGAFRGVQESGVKLMSEIRRALFK